MQPTNAASARFVFFLHFNQKGHFISTRADIGSKCVLFRSWDKFLSNSGGVSQFIILLNHFLLADFATGRAYKEDKYTGRRIISFRARPACLPACRGGRGYFKISSLAPRANENAQARLI
jgi:hypothetical protein